MMCYMIMIITLRAFSSNKRGVSIVIIIVSKGTLSTRAHLWLQF